MKQILFFLWLLCLLVRPCVLTAQQHAITPRQLDSLTRLMQSPLPSKEQMKIFKILSDYWRTRDTRKAMAYAHQMFDIASSRKDRLHMGAAILLEGNVLNTTDELDSAMAKYDQALSLLEPLKERESLRYQTRIWNSKGIILQKKDSSEQYLTILLNKIIPISEKIKDSLILPYAFANVAALLTNSERYDRARIYLDSATGAYKSFLDPDQLAKSYLLYTKGALFKEKPELPFAEKYLKLAQAVLQQDTSSRVWVIYYGMEGQCHFLRNRFPEALQSFNMGLALGRRWQVGYDLLFPVWGKAETCLKLNRFAEAKQYMYALDSLVDVYHMKFDRLAVLRKIAFLEGETGNYPLAFQKLKAYVLHADTANELKTNIAIATMEEKYQDAKKESKIRQLQSTNRFNRYMTLSFIALTILLVLLLLLIRSRYRVRKKMAEREALLLQQKIQQQEQEQQYEIAKALLEGEERERRRLAGDLHDGLGGMLATARMNLTGLTIETGDTQQGLDKVIGQLDQSVNELRRIARNMMPEALLRSGLETALTDLCASLSAGGINMDYQMIGIPGTTPGQQELVIYRIVQELLANVLRHAGATEVFVQCSQRDHTFHITVEDNGKGLDEGEAGMQKGIGMNNVRNRVAFLQGKMDIRSSPGKGTAIDIELQLS